MEEEKTLKWRLTEKPTTDNLLKLTEGGIITKEEAKKILLAESVVTQSDIESIKSEISLMRKMILEVIEKTNTQREIIRIVEKEIPIYVEQYRRTPMYPYPWWNDTIRWCNSQFIDTASSIDYPNVVYAFNKLLP